MEAKIGFLLPRFNDFFWHEKLKFSIELLLFIEKISVKLKHHSGKPAQDFRSLYYHVWYFINCFDLTTKFGERRNQLAAF